MLTELEQAGIKLIDQKVVVGVFGDDTSSMKTNNEEGDGESGTHNIAARIRLAGKAISEISFALAEDLGCFDVDQDLDDRYEMNIRRKEQLMMLQRQQQKKKKNSSTPGSEHIWKVVALVVGVAAFVVGT